MNLEEWASGVKFAGSRKRKDEIKTIIKEKCLCSEKRYMGAYLIDGNKVWDVLIKNDVNCQRVCKEKNIQSAIDIESIIEAKKYRAFWGANKQAYGKKRR